MISYSPSLRHRSHIYSLADVIFHKRWGILAFVFILLSISCKQGSDIEQEALYGKWDILNAKRNGNETHYLRGGYVIIDSNGTMTINLTGTEEKGPYVITDKTIRVSNTKDFLIESLKPDSMTLHYVMSPESDFLIRFTKHKDETN